MLGTLQENMIVTIEPGCYFNPMMFTRGAKEWKISIDPVDRARVEEYQKEEGGVRIEDVVLITENGSLNHVKVPRTVKEIEDFMTRGNWD